MIVKVLFKNYYQTNYITALGLHQVRYTKHTTSQTCKTDMNKTHISWHSAEERRFVQNIVQ